MLGAALKIGREDQRRGAAVHVGVQAAVRVIVIAVRLLVGMVRAMLMRVMTVVVAHRRREVMRIAEVPGMRRTDEGADQQCRDQDMSEQVSHHAKTTPFGRRSQPCGDGYRQPAAAAPVSMGRLSSAPHSAQLPS